jgi:hypothetical protein
VTAFVGPLWDAVVVGYRLTITPDRLQGRVASVDWFLSVSLAAAGPVAAGYLLSTIETRDTLLVVAGLLAVFAALGSWAPSLRQPPASASRHREHAGFGVEPRGHHPRMADDDHDVCKGSGIDAPSPDGS